MRKKSEADAVFPAGFAESEALAHVQKTELRALKGLQRQIENLEKQLARAERRAHGTGKRNKEGFRERGCGCRTCVARVDRVQNRLDAARQRYQDELQRLTPQRNTEPVRDTRALLPART